MELFAQVQLVILCGIVVFQFDKVVGNGYDLPVFVEAAENGIGAKGQAEFGTGLRPGTANSSAAFGGCELAIGLETDGPAGEIGGLIFFVPVKNNLPLAGG